MPISRLASLVCAILAGVAIALFVLDRIFSFIPTDIQRLGILFEVIESRRQTPELSPEIVVFGNSVIMSGIDTRALTEALPEHPLALNFSSPGQSLVEAFLLAQDLPESVEIAVYSIYVQSVKTEDPIPSQRYNTLFMYGYRPRPETLATLERIYDPAATSTLERSTISQVFLSRWALRQWIDTQFRIFLRSDLTLTEAAADLYHPQRYMESIDSTISARRIEEQDRSFRSTPPIVPAETTELALRIAENAAGANRQTLFFIQPMHPDLFAAHAAAIRRAVADFEEIVMRVPQTRVIEALDVLDRSHFIDENHPTNAGAEILTSHLANAMRR